MILTASLSISFKKTRLWQLYTDSFMSRLFAAPLSEKHMTASISTDMHFPLNIASHWRDRADDQTHLAQEPQLQGGLKQDVLDVIMSPAIEKPEPLSRVLLEATGVSIALEVYENQTGGLMVSGQFIVNEQSLSSWYDAIVQLWQDGRLKRFTVVNNSGVFSFKADYTHAIRLVAINRNGQVAMFNPFDFPEQNRPNE